MADHRSVLVAFTAGVLASMPVAGAALEPVAFADATQTPQVTQSKPDPVQLQPCCRFTNYYLWPSGPIYYQCCAAPPELVADPLSSGSSPAASEVPRLPPGKVTINEKNPRVLGRGVESTCVNLSELTPFERFVRSVRALGTCVDFVAYDHFPCSCETKCNDVTWLCDCPGVPPGQLPEIGPQDSLGSRPEFLGTICLPCNQQSTCSGDVEPPPPPPA